MRISKASNATPHSTPPSRFGSGREGDTAFEDEQFIWRMLVPRLVHPTRLQIVEALIDKGSSMTAEELVPLVPHVEGNVELVRYHAKAMTKAGALEVTNRSQARAGGRGEEPSIFFPLAK